MPRKFLNFIKLPKNLTKSLITIFIACSAPFNSDSSQTSSAWDLLTEEDWTLLEETEYPASLVWNSATEEWNTYDEEWICIEMDAYEIFCDPINFDGEPIQKEIPTIEVTYGSELLLLTFSDFEHRSYSPIVQGNETHGPSSCIEIVESFEQVFESIDRACFLATHFPKGIDGDRRYPERWEISLIKTDNYLWDGVLLDQKQLDSDEGDSARL
ncbi:MAG: hypothetical protein COV44_02340 [Deltaproteobacteria bacterium CG11_big_fil_rev_8_21_14_0_20_45_16]|nr:MAG: hypothetical protein COV44_02340 [Deltaproteobacteria bacterium CG11_big_fil_rev_8_21_14_0_20_45_16]